MNPNYCAWQDTGLLSMVRKCVVSIPPEWEKNEGGSKQIGAGMLPVKGKNLRVGSQ